MLGLMALSNITLDQRKGCEMRHHFVSFAVAFLFIFFTIALCWGTIDVDIAISTQPNWITQQAADREANEIVSRVGNSVNDISIFTKDQESQLASWVQSHTNNSQLDILILFGVFPNSIYPNGNKQPDGSIAEKFLEAGNMIINTADYMFYIPYNNEWGIRNMMDLQDVTMWFGGDMKVTNSGNQYLPNLSPYSTTRALKLDGIKSPWTVEAVFGQNTEGTLAEPVVVRDTVTGGRLAIFYQLINDDAPRGEVISEFILNWLPTVAGGTAEPGDGDVTPPVTPGEFVLMGTDPDEDTLGVLADIYQVFASSDASQVKFKVTTYRNWGEYADFYVDMDVDQNPNTGYPENGVDYSVYVSRRGGNILGGLWFYDPSQRDYVATNASIDALFDPNSNVFQVYVNRSDIGNPDAIDFEVWLMEGDLLDVAPEVGFYTYDLTGTGPVDGDTTPLAITSGPLVSNITSSSALVSWSTDEVSDSLVQYGKTSSYGLTASGADDVREHSVLLTSLSPDTTYYYRAGSTDSSGNTVWSIQRSFKTNAQGVIPPISQGGPVIYLPFDEGSGTLAKDATANGNNGTLQGNVTWVNGKYGKAIYINEDSANNMVVVRDSSTLDVTDEMTMAAWVYVESIPNLWSVIAIKEGSYMLHIQSSQPDFDVGLVLNVNGSVGTWPDSSVAKASMNQWHHVVGVYDGDKQYTYIDGELKGTYARKGTIDVTDSDLVIGHDSRSWCNYRKTAQVIDEFMIFNRALSQAEIQQIMGGTIPSGQPADGTIPPVSTRSLVIPEVTAEPGESVTVPINIDNASGLAGADITVTYNSSILTVDQVKSTTLSAGINLVPNTNTPGRIILRMAGNAIVSGSGALVDMVFTVSSSISEDTETPVSFESAEAYDANGQNISISTQNGKVKIASPRKKGDVNNDRKINAADAILALRISAELKPATPDEFWAADMNGDGKVGSNDAILILLEISKSSAPGRESIASGGRNTSVALGEAHGIAGESITVPLRVDNASILAGGDVCIAYDSSVLRAVSVSSESDMLMEANLAEPGSVRIAFANSGRLDDDVIATLEFEIMADDVSTLTLRAVELYGGDALPIDVRKIDGQFASWAIPPEHTALLQNFPNPFNPETWIPYQLKEDGEVTIRIYDATGGLVRGLELGHKSAGLYVSRDRSAYWDGRNETGEPVASGVYFYTIQAGEFAATRKMIIAR
jgi:hypothetical protein